MALRPHPDLQAIIDNLMLDMKQKTLDRLPASASFDVDNVTYMALHARVEPDMQKHNMCKTLKVYNLHEVVSWTEKYFSLTSSSTTGQRQPPSFIFLSLNREMFDIEMNHNNTIAKNNLIELDRILKDGMFNGTVPVYHGYSNVLKGTRYENRTSTAQAMMSYLIALDSSVFVGTPVSSYSQALASARFHRGIMENYVYLPNGIIDQWTLPGAVRPPEFSC